MQAMNVAVRILLVCFSAVLVKGCDNYVRYSIGGAHFCVPRENVFEPSFLSLRYIFKQVTTREITSVEGFSFVVKINLGRGTEQSSSPDKEQQSVTLSANVEGLARARGMIKPVSGWNAHILRAPETIHKHFSQLIGGKEYLISHNTNLDRSSYLVWRQERHDKNADPVFSEEDEIFAVCHEYRDDARATCIHAFQRANVSVFYEVPLVNLQVVPNIDRELSERLDKWKCE